ncbi:hypothetical protein GmHk_12G035412 [Glycine max]|nr:hypothetical protein GmHk_12G035412 [Glycine max]
MVVRPTLTTATHTTRQTKLSWLPYQLRLSQPTHSPNHLSSLLPLHTTLHQQPPSLSFQHTPRMAYAELSAAREDRLKAALAKHVAAQRRLESTLDALLLKLPLRTNHHYPSSSVQSPLPPPSPMPTPPLLPTLIQSRPTPLPAFHLSNLGHVSAAIPISDHLFSVVLSYGHAIAPHDKHGENRDITLFKRGPGFFGTIMVSRKCLPAVFALWTGAKTSAFLQDKPWDPGITFGSHALQPQHLEDKVFLMGQGMIIRLGPRNPIPHFSSSIPAKAPISAIIISTPRLMLSPPPTPTPPPMPPPTSMSIAPPCPTPVQPFTAPLPTPLPMPAAYLPDLQHTRATVSCNKLFGTVASYGRATTPNDKALEGRNMTLFEIGTKYHGHTMVACKHQPTMFALWTAADPEESRRNRPWDSGIDFGSHYLKPNTLRTRCFRWARECYEEHQGSAGSKLYADQKKSHNSSLLKRLSATGIAEAHAACTVREGSA